MSDYIFRQNLFAAWKRNSDTVNPAFTSAGGDAALPFFLSHHLKHKTNECAQLPRRGNDEPGPYPVTTLASIWHTTNSI